MCLTADADRAQIELAINLDNTRALGLDLPSALEEPASKVTE